MKKEERDFNLRIDIWVGDKCHWLFFQEQKIEAKERIKINWIPLI